MAVSAWDTRRGSAKVPRNRGDFSGCARVRAGSLCSSRLVGGESGIRTHGTFRYTRFPSVRLQPLGHLSAQHDGGLRVRSPEAKTGPRTIVAEREGFEPSVELPLRRFSKPVPSAARPPLLQLGNLASPAYPRRAGRAARRSRAEFAKAGILAEREGFEPSRRVNAWRFSRPLPSTTRPPLLSL